jgi:hypothetical protein
VRRLGCQVAMSRSDQRLVRGGQKVTARQDLGDRPSRREGRSGQLELRPFARPMRDDQRAQGQTVLASTKQKS